MRKIISIILLMTLIISLTACGQQNTNETTSSESQAETAQYKTDEFQDHHIGNLYGGDNIVVRVWAGKSVLNDSTDDNGNITYGYSYAHDITITYKVNQSETEDLIILLQNAIRDERHAQKAIANFNIVEAKKDEEKVWAVVNYGDSTTTEEKIIYVRPTGNNSYLCGSISYFTYIKEGYNESLASQKYIDLVQQEYKVTANDGEPIEIEESIVDYTLHEVDIPGYKNETVATAYTWDDPQSFYMSYSDDDTSNEPEEGTYINGFTSSLSGNYISVEVYNGHKDNIYNIFDNFMDTFSYMAPDDATYSGPIGDATKSYIVIHYDYTDNIPDGTIVYLVELGKDGHKAITIETSADADQAKFKEALEAYGIDFQDTLPKEKGNTNADSTPEDTQSVATETESNSDTTQN